jgi:hypothetical protein
MQWTRQILAGMLLAQAILAPHVLTGADKSKPHVAPVHNVVDEYYGTKVDDPYRYMEKLDDPEVTTWFKAQALSLRLLSKPFTRKRLSIQRSHPGYSPFGSTAVIQRTVGD